MSASDAVARRNKGMMRRFVRSARLCGAIVAAHSGSFWV